MAKLTISLPDDLADAARAAGLDVSAVTQRAVAEELRRRRTDEWLGRVAALPGTSATHEHVLHALDGARVDLGR